MANYTVIEILDEAPPTVWTTTEWLWATVKVQRFNSVDPFSTFFRIRHYVLTTAQRIRFSSTDYEILRVWNLDNGEYDVECIQV